MSARAWRVADAVFLLLFALSVAVQVNDPDPAGWMLVYGAGAAACALSLRGRLRWWVPAAVGAIALAWAVTIAPRVLGRVAPREMFAAWEMKDAGVEESREMYGLLLVAGWMAVLAVRGARGSAQGA